MRKSPDNSPSLWRPPKEMSDRAIRLQLPNRHPRPGYFWDYDPKTDEFTEKFVEEGAIDMAVPGSFPAKMQLADGREAIVYNVAGYNAVIAVGGSYGIATPTVAKTGTITVVGEALNLEQSDGRPNIRQGGRD